MKKITLLFFLCLFLNYNLKAQDYNVNDITYKISKGYTDGCIGVLIVDFKIPVLLKGTRNFSWGDYFYEFEIELWGHKADGTNQLINTVTKQTYNYSSFDGEYYVYRSTYDSDYYDFVNFEYVHSRLKIQRYTYNNDPGLGLYLALQDWDYKWTNQASMIGECSNSGGTSGVNKPDLEITNFNFQSSANQTAGQSYFNINNDTGSNIHYTLDVKNSGNKNAGQFKFQVYLSKSGTFSSSTNNAIDNTYIGSLNAGSVKSLSNYIYIANYNYFDSSGYYYFHFVVDKDGSSQVDESNENNNVKTQKVYYTMPSSRPPKDLLMQMRPNNNNESDLLDEPYTVQVYNFSNLKILEQTVINKDGESTIIKNLPIGLYIIKSKFGSRKIHVRH